MTYRTIALIALTALIPGFTAMPAPAHPQPAVSKSSDGVTVKRNSDGTLEVYDTPDSEGEVARTSQGSASRSRASAGTSTRAQSAELKSETATAQTDSQSESPTELTADSVFAVKPVVSTRKPQPRATSTHKTWTHNISAL